MVLGIAEGHLAAAIASIYSFSESTPLNFIVCHLQCWLQLMSSSIPLFRMSRLSNTSRFFLSHLEINLDQFIYSKMLGWPPEIALETTHISDESIFAVPLMCGS